MLKRGFLLLFILYFVLPVVQIGFYLEAIGFVEQDINDITISDFLEILNYLASILALAWILNNILLIIKIPVLQNLFPYDWRVRFHVLASLGIFICLTYHFFYKLLAGRSIDVVSWTLSGLTVLLFIPAAIWITLPGFKILRRLAIERLGLRLIGSYDFLKKWHNIFFIIFAFFIYIHIIQAELFDTAAFPSGLLYQGHFFISMSFYFFYRIRLLFLPRLYVREVHLGQGIVHLKLTASHRLSYQAGQFAFLRFDHIKLRGEEHPFSFLTAPYQQHVEFGIKILGDFTQNLLLLKEGDQVRVNGGFGNFYPRKKKQPLCLIASGIGIVPLISLLRNFSHHENDREILCFFSLHNMDEVPGREQFEKACHKLKHLRFYLLQPNNDEKKERYGYNFFMLKIKDPQRFEYFLCSSNKIRLAVVKALRTLGVARKRIHYEAFSFNSMK